MYEYNALVTGVYDGDSITVDIDLGFGIKMMSQKLRLLGIDTPELRGEEREIGLDIRDFVRDICLDKEVVIHTKRDSKGKYGRWLATVYVGDVNLNQVLLDNDLAKPYMD